MIFGGLLTVRTVAGVVCQTIITAFTAPLESIGGIATWVENRIERLIRTPVAARWSVWRLGVRWPPPLPKEQGEKCLDHGQCRRRKSAGQRMEAIGDVSLNSQRSPTEADFVSSRDDS